MAANSRHGKTESRRWSPWVALLLMTALVIGVSAGRQHAPVKKHADPRPELTISELPSSHMDPFRIRRHQHLDSEDTSSPRVRHMKHLRRGQYAAIQILAKPSADTVNAITADGGKPNPDRRKRYSYFDKNGVLRYGYYPLAECCGYPTISCNYPIRLKPVSTPRPTYGPSSRYWKGLAYGKTFISLVQIVVNENMDMPLFLIYHV